MFFKTQVHMIGCAYSPSTKEVVIVNSWCNNQLAGNDST